MPLIVLCGGLCSGRTTRALEMQRFFQGILDRNHHHHHHDDDDDKDGGNNGDDKDASLFRSQVRRVSLVSDDVLFGRGRGSPAHHTAGGEKVARAEVKAAVERLLSRHDLVIVDAPNIIKGFRYELHCIARQHATQQATVFCDTPLDTAIQWDMGRAQEHKERHDHQQDDNSGGGGGGGGDGGGGGRLYTDEQMRDVHGRIERPDPRRRWDRPLFTLQPHDSTPLQDILHAMVSDGSRPRPNVSTVPQRLGDASLLFEVDRMTAEIVRRLAAARQQAAMPGDRIPVCDACPDARVRIPQDMDRQLAPVALKRHRQQFLKMAQLDQHSISTGGGSPADMARSFIAYLNTQFEHHHHHHMH